MSKEGRVNRREFIQNAGLLISAMHISGYMKPAEGSEMVMPSEARPVEFLRLRLRATCPSELRDFYKQVLELPTDISKDAETQESLSVRAGGTELLFVPNDGAPNPFYHFAFNIPENKLDSAIEWMRGRAELILQPSTGSQIFNYPHWNANSIYYLDLAGNILEFIARHNLKNAAPGKFDSRDILYASEMGLVVPEVSAAVGQLHRRLGITDYIGVSDVFAPVGNEHGLFIVVHKDRKWFSRIPPGIFPAEVRMRGGTAGKYSIPESSLEVEVVS